MRISYFWLQTYFEKELATPEKIAELLTAHSFEIESIEKVMDDTVFDVKVLPDRAHDCLSHIGVAREVAVLSGIPLKKEYSTAKTLNVPESNLFRAEISNPKLCRRFSAIVIEGVEVKDSPLWLEDRLKAIGQRSINNIVDAINYVMFATGQPLHAYDRELLTDSNGGWKIGVRLASDGEKLTALDGKEYTLSSENLIIVDGNTDKALGIAGVKGGKATEITNKTKNIILEAANFDPISVRKTAKKLGLRTDASVRFENEITPELTTEALAEVAELIMDIAKGEKTQVEGFFDWYPRKGNLYKVGVSLSEIRAILGIDISQREVEDILNRRGYPWTQVSPRESIISLAEKLIGVPYVYGSSVLYDAPKTFDCSSFTAFLFTQVGIAIPRISIDQYVFSNKIDNNDLKPGDLVFTNTGQEHHTSGSYFSQVLGKQVEQKAIRTESLEFMPGTKVPQGVDHVGLYIGNGEIIHARFGEDVAQVKREKISDPSFFGKILLSGRIDSIDEDRFVLTIPAERLDLRIKEDVVEEVGRIYGYENITPQKIGISKNPPEIEKISYYSDLLRDILVEQGFSEVYTYAFWNTGVVGVANPIAEDKIFLRKSLENGLDSVMAKNSRNAVFLGLDQIKVFEIGKIFPNEETEILAFMIGVLEIGKKNSSGGLKNILKKISTKIQSKDDLSEFYVPEVARSSVTTNESGGPRSVTGIREQVEINLSELVSTLPEPTESINYQHNDSTFRFKAFSHYPFIVRDVAVFVPEGTEQNTVLNLIQKESGELLQKTRLFDVFTKPSPDGTKKTSYAYRLVFQSFEKTLTDEEVNIMMGKVTNILNAQEGWQVR